MQIKLTRTICNTYAPQCGKIGVACQKVNRECVWGMLNLSRKQENKVTVLRRKQIFMIGNHFYVPNLCSLHRHNGEWRQ